ncbi:MAG: hypothetical protein C0410_16145, partial [Anaerolinea sp.]|nr:hypothetical protein [Anaerolinea sp.]
YNNEVATLQCFECIVQNILNIAVRLAGIAVFIFIIIGGFQYLTAGGDPKKAESAKNTLTYAILGLALLILAWFILKFISIFTGLPEILEFKIPVAD